VPGHAGKGSDDGLIVVGRISGVYGVKGWVKIYSDTTPKENILTYSPWMLKIRGVWQERKLVQGRTQGKGLVAKIEGLDDRNEAELLQETLIAIRQEQLPALSQGEYYWRDLIGLAVVNLKGEELGVVDHLLETGANDVLAVKGGRERLIPFVVGPIVQTVDLEQRKITVDWESDY